MDTEPYRDYTEQEAHRGATESTSYGPGADGSVIEGVIDIAFDVIGSILEGIFD